MSDPMRDAQRAADALGDLFGSSKRAVGGTVEGTAKDVGKEIESAFGDIFSGAKSLFSGETEVGDMSREQVVVLQKALNVTAGYRGPMDGSTEPTTLGAMKKAIDSFAAQHPNKEAEKPVRGVDSNTDIAIDNDTLQDIMSDYGERSMNGEQPYVEPPAAPPPPAKAPKGGKGR